MATVKISELPALTGANTAATDVIPIVDVSGNITNKITRDEFFKNIQGNVGIGVAAPSVALQIGGVAGGDRTLQMGSAGATRGVLSTNGTNGTLTIGATNDSTTGTLIFQTGAALAERMRISDTGNVGINSTNPVNRLQVVQTPLASVPAAGASGHQLAVGTTPYGVASGVLSDGRGYIQATRWDGTATNYDLLIQPNGGGIGVGTSTPVSARALTLNSTANYFGLVLQTSGSTQGQIMQESTGNLYIDSGVTNTGGGTVFRTSAGTQRMMVTAAGNLVVGNGETSATPASGAIQVPNGSGTDIVGATMNLFGGRGTGTGAGGPIILATAAAGGVSGTALNPVAERMRITPAGNVGIGTNNPSTALQVVGTVTATAFAGPLTGAVTGNASTATALQNTRTIWGQNFTGAANVTGDLTGVGNITGAAGVALLTTTTGVLALDSGTTGAINIGTNANAKTITIGNGTGATSVVLDAGTGPINIGTNAIARTTTVGNATGASSVVVNSGTGHILLNGGNTNRVGINTTAPLAPLHVAGDTITTGVNYFSQPAQTTKAALATLTIAELETGIIQYTGAAATLTMPTGTDIESGVPASLPVNQAFDFSVINTGTGIATIATNTGLTLVGTMTVAVGASAIIRVRKTATNTYTIYRIS